MSLIASRKGHLSQRIGRCRKLSALFLPRSTQKIRQAHRESKGKTIERERRELAVLPHCLCRPSLSLSSVLTQSLIHSCYVRYTRLLFLNLLHLCYYGEMVDDMIKSNHFLNIYLLNYQNSSTRLILDFFLRILNEISSREMDKIDVFKGILDNYVFVIVLGSTVIFQIIIIKVLETFATATPLSMSQLGDR